jgi:hypothetical protein
MVANISPSSGCCEHTLNTLRYSDRVKELKKENRQPVNPLMLPRAANSKIVPVKKAEENNLVMPSEIFKRQNSNGAIPP